MAHRTIGYRIWKHLNKKYGSAHTPPKYTQGKGYNITGINNHIIIVENGIERELEKNEIIEGLNINLSGKDNIIKIESPHKFFDCVLDVDSVSSYIEIRKNTCWGLSRLSVRAKYGEKQKLIIGENATCSTLLINLDEDSSVEIGNDCMFGGGIEILPSDGHAIYDVDTNEILNKSGHVCIGNHCWIAARCILLKNTKILNNSIIAAGSVVTKAFDKKNIIAAGNPAKLIKENTNWDRCNSFYYKKTTQI